MGIERYCDDSGNHRSISKAKSAWRCDPQKDYENISYLYGGRRNATGSGGIGQWKTFAQIDFVSAIFEPL